VSLISCFGTVVARLRDVRDMKRFECLKIAWCGGGAGAGRA